ncbi:uncharacterized protein LOC118757196 [Rhagoletis pomonella]|uniref:uncharacterized protein LOC118757196 n=1 Tax=Rhagoletis pomonella TaxID=28610 RepID=UPI001786E50A|nr:uncharacterized protein LOC118757196 [Rhagoletis pomonella]
MDDERLIILVQAHKELYDKSSPLYKLKERKKLVWEHIARELHTTGDICLQRWLALRDRYGREMRKTTSASGSGAQYFKPWYLLEMLQFLKPHVVPRPLRCSQNICKVPLPSQSILTVTPSYSSPHTSVVVNPPSLQMSPSLPVEVALSSPLSPTPEASPSPSPPINADLLSPQTNEASPTPSPPNSSLLGSSSSSLFTSVQSSSPSPSPLPSTSTVSPSPAQRSKRRKRSEGDVDVGKAMCDAIELFKKRCLENEDQNANPALRSFGNMIVSMLEKVNAAKQSRAMQRIMEVAIEVQQEP